MLRGGADMAWQDMPRPQQLGILIAVPLVLALGLAYMAHRSLYELGEDPALERVSFVRNTSNRRSVWSTIQSHRDDIRDMEIKLEEAPEIQAQLEALLDEQDRLEEEMPSQAEIPEMRQWLQNRAEGIPSDIGRLSFMSVNIQQSGQGGGRGRGQQTTGDFTTITFECRLEGDFNGFLYYLDQVENSTLRFMRVRDFQVTPGRVSLDDERGELVKGAHQFTINIVTFVYHGGSRN